MKDPRFLTAGMLLAEALKKTKWYQFKKRKAIEFGIMASYFDYTGKPDIANKLFNQIKI